MRAFLRRWLEGKGVIDKIVIDSFKRIHRSEIQLGAINVLVGGNNAGKSCFLQGIHFGVALSQSRRIAYAQQFSPEKLRYCPTDDFLSLRHKERLTETAAIAFRFERDDGKDFADISLTRGRNGVVKVVSEGGALLAEVSDPATPFSIYVPGLAGISIREEYRTDLVVNNGIARGDANLYLRNVLWRIQSSAERLARFQALLNEVFPAHEVVASFDQGKDLWIRADVRLADDSLRALDTAGTGLLQAVQLLAYVTNYGPRVLLLDEPDAHLHPSKQRLLAHTLHLIASQTDTQIVLATHSRHLLDALSDYSNAKLYWIKDGEAILQDMWSNVAVLMDLGALDKGERLLAGELRTLVWTEDTDTSWLEQLLIANGFASDETFIFSYKASSKIDAAVLMAHFISRIRPGVRVIIHRDRDFMSDEEVGRLVEKYRIVTNDQARLFITRGTDVESYFTQAEHLAGVLNLDVERMRLLVERIVRDNNAHFVVKFRDKRETVKFELYKNDPANCPATDGLIPPGLLPVEQAHGKMLCSFVSQAIQTEYGINPARFKAPSPGLVDEGLRALLPQ